MYKSKLPQEIETISVTCHKNAGMLRYMENIRLSEDSCTYKVDRMGVIQNATYNVTAEEFQKLYQVFIENEFDRIKKYEEQVYDRGGSGISLNINESGIKTSLFFKLV